MNVAQVNGEPTRFVVESATLECAACLKQFNRRETRFKLLQIDGDCPKCNATESLRERHHLVDLANYHPVGQCSCEHFSMRLIKNVEKLSPTELLNLTHNQQEALRCTHIEAARQYALNLTVAQHERERLGGRKELIT